MRQHNHHGKWSVMWESNPRRSVPDRECSHQTLITESPSSSTGGLRKCNVRGKMVAGTGFEPVLLAL